MCGSKRRNRHPLHKSVAKQCWAYVASTCEPVFLLNRPLNKPRPLPKAAAVAVKRRSCSQEHD